MNVGKVSVINSTNLKSNRVLAFQGKENETGEKRSLAGKKWGVGIASFLCPGLGQLANGQVGRAFSTFFTWAGFAIITTIGAKLASDSTTYIQKSEKKIEKGLNKLTSLPNFENLKFNQKTPKGAIALTVIGVIGALVTKIYSIVDAVKQAKPDKE